MSINSETLNKELVIKDKLSIRIHPIGDINAQEWDQFLNRTSESTFFCTTDWWKTFEDSFLLQIRDSKGKLLGGVPFRTLSVLPIIGKYFRFTWLDSSVLVKQDVEEKEITDIKKSAFQFLLDYLKSTGVVVMFISTKSRSHDGELFEELFNSSEKCATFINNLILGEDEIYKLFEKGKRYAIRSAIKANVEIKISEGISGFPLIADYCYLQDKMFKHNRKQYSNIYYKDEQYLKSILSSDNSHIALAYFNGQPAAGCIMVGHKKMMYGYLGASDNKLNRISNASTLLEYEIMKFAKRKGFYTYDFGGASLGNPKKTDALYGVHMYKKGFGGSKMVFDCCIHPISKYRYSFVWWLRQYENHTFARKIYDFLTKNT